MPVVYDGVAGSSQGDLFKGLKIWIAQRVPLRSKWVDLVKGNGGEVPRLETNADMHIADNVKRCGIVPPPGSYSYQWIEFSVKNGQLENKDDYEIGPPPGTSRKAGSAQQTKASRTNFSFKDDLILIKWVRSAECKGQATSGNEVYKDLERCHPHHTWQSWRDRWVKKLKDGSAVITSPDSLDLEFEEDDAHAAKSNGTTTMSTNHTKNDQDAHLAQTKVQKPSVPHSEYRIAKHALPSTATDPSVRKRRLFTQEEDQMLMAIIQEARDRGESLNGNLLYQQIAEKHPTRTWQSWRDRWVRHLSLRDSGLENDEGSSRVVRSTDRANRQKMERPPTSTAGKSTLSRPAKIHSTSESSDNASITTKPAPDSSTSELNPNPRSDDERLNRQEETRRRLRAAKMLQKSWRGHSVRKVLKADQATLEAAIVPLQAMIRGFLARRGAMERLAESPHADQAVLEADLVAYSQEHEQQEEANALVEAMPQLNRNMMDQFYGDLQNYIEFTGANINQNPLICGFRIDLWDLYRIAKQQDCEPEQRDMRVVADEMGLDWNKFPEIPKTLQQFYHQNLTDFEDAMDKFENDDILSDDVEQQVDDSEDENLPQTSDAVTAPKEPLIDHSSPGYRSSPPVAGSKRSYRYTELLTSDTGYPSEGSRKRRRLDKSSVIPPTPDGKLGPLKEQFRHSLLQNGSSPLKSRGENSELPIELSSDEESGMFVGQGWEEDHAQNELPTHMREKTQKHLEPETQDWGFATQYMPQDQPQDSEIYESIEMDDVSPSQQLQMESRSHHSPDQYLPTRQAIETRARSHHSSVPTNPKPSELATVEPRRSTRQRAATQQSPVISSHTIDVSRAKKRALPAEYQQDATPTTARAQKVAPPQDSAPTLKPLLRPQMPTKSRMLARTPVRTPKEAYGSSTAAFTQTPATPATQRPIRTPASAKRPKLVFDDAYVQSQIDHFEALGYNALHIANAMWAATFQRGPQTVALQSLHEGGGLPENEPGIWTEKDVRDLEWIKQYEEGEVAGSARDKVKVRVWRLRNRLTEKHGEEGVKLRQQFESEITEQTRQKKGKACAT